MHEVCTHMEKLLVVNHKHPHTRYVILLPA